MYGLIAATLFLIGAIAGHRTNIFADVIPVIMLVYALGVMYDILTLHSL